jgi:hypothetical protein
MRSGAPGGRLGQRTWSWDESRAPGSRPQEPLRPDQGSSEGTTASVKNLTTTGRNPSVQTMAGPRDPWKIGLVLIGYVVSQSHQPDQGSSERRWTGLDRQAATRLQSQSHHPDKGSSEWPSSFKRSSPRFAPLVAIPPSRSGQFRVHYHAALAAHYAQSQSLHPDQGSSECNRMCAGQQIWQALSRNPSIQIRAVPRRDSDCRISR